MFYGFLFYYLIHIKYLICWNCIFWEFLFVIQFRYSFYHRTLELLPCTVMISILPTPMESISYATCSIRRLPDMPSTLWRLKKLFALSIEKLTILPGQVTIWAKILWMPCGFCIGVLLLSNFISSSPCVRMLPLSFKVPVIVYLQ